MKHEIDGKTVDIDWDKDDKIDSFGDGGSEWALTGEDEDGNKYSASGYYLSGELEEVYNIEKE